MSGHVGNYTITGLTNGNTYQIEITGNFPGLYIANGTEKSKIRTIERWGNVVWTSMASSFYGCDVLISNATDSPDVSQVTNMSYTFYGARAFNADLSGWDVSKVTTMRFMFYMATVFNGNISPWNVSNVTDMSAMFSGATILAPSQENWKVYPNPFTTELTIEPPSPQKTEVEIVDIQGRSVKSFSLEHEHVLPTHELHEGFYFLRIKTIKGTLQFKITRSE